MKRQQLSLLQNGCTKWTPLGGGWTAIRRTWKTILTRMVTLKSSTLSKKETRKGWTHVFFEDNDITNIDHIGLFTNYYKGIKQVTGDPVQAPHESAIEAGKDPTADQRDHDHDRLVAVAWGESQAQSSAGDTDNTSPDYSDYSEATKFWKTADFVQRKTVGNRQQEEGAWAGATDTYEGNFKQASLRQVAVPIDVRHELLAKKAFCLFQLGYNQQALNDAEEALVYGTSLK